MDLIPRIWLLKEFTNVIKVKLYGIVCKLCML